MRNSILVGLLALGLFGTSVAAAQDGAEGGGDSPENPRDVEARHLFEAGRLAFDQGRFEEALDYFRRSHSLSQRPALLYNIGSAADRLRRDDEAIEAFEAYVAQVPDAPNRAEVESRLEVLRRSRARSVPTPAETAAQAQTSTPAEPVDEGSPITSKWWFWTGLGVIVAGAIVATVLIAGSSGGTQDPLPGTDGWVVETLEMSR